MDSGRTPYPCPQRAGIEGARNERKQRSDPRDRLPRQTQRHTVMTRIMGELPASCQPSAVRSGRRRTLLAFRACAGSAPRVRYLCPMLAMVRIPILMSYNKHPDL